MNSENSDNEFSFPQSLTPPLADLFNDSYNFDNSYPASLEENNGGQFQNQDLSSPVLSHHTTEGSDDLDHESNLEVNKSSVEYTANSLENGAPLLLENPFDISEPVDDYSLYYIMSMGIRYCASLKKNGEGNNNSTTEGSPSNSRVKQIHPVLTSPNEVAGESYGGGTGKSPLEEHHKAPLQQYQPSTLESSMYPGIRRYAGNLQTFLRGKPRPQKKGKTAGGFKVKEEPVWAYDMESTKFQSKSSTSNCLPSYREDELKEVSKDEYSTALRSKSKDISKGTSTHRGVPRISTKKSDDEKWKAILWSAQECKEPAAQASDSPAIRLSGNGKGLETNDNAGGSYSEGIQEAGQNQTLQFYQNHNFTEQAPEKNSSSSQLSHGCQNTDFQTYPSVSYGSGSGMENCTGGCSKNVAAEGSLMKLDNEDDIFSGIWKDCDPLSPFVDDGFILPASQNKDFQIHDQNKNCTNQVMQQNPSSSVSHGYTNPTSPDNHPALLPKMIDTGFGGKAGGSSSDGSNQVFTSSGNPNPDSTLIETTKVSTKGGTVEESPIKGLIAMENSVELTFPEIEGLEICKQNQAEFSFSFDWTNDLLLPTDLFGGGK